MKAIKSTAKSVNINLLGEQVKVSIITDGTYVDLITKTDFRPTIDGIHTEDGYRRINRQYVKHASVVGYEEYISYAKSYRLVHHMDGLEELIDTHIEAAYQTVDFGWLMDRAYVAYAMDESDRSTGDSSALAAYAIISGWYTIAGSDTATTCAENAEAAAIRVMGNTCDTLHKALAKTEDAEEQTTISKHTLEPTKAIETTITQEQAEELHTLRLEKALSWYELAEKYNITEREVRRIYVAVHNDIAIITTTDQQVAADAVKQPSKSVEATEQQAEEMIISEEPTEATTEATEQPSAAAVIAAIILAATSVIEHIAGIALTGSTKQVAWATDIRNGWLNLIAQTLRGALNDAIAEHDIVQAAYAAEASAKSLANIAGCTSARSIIDARYVDTVYELQHKALNKADEDVRQTLIDAAKNATEADIAAVLDQPKSEADILAEKLEAAGGNRWTKGTNDRVYVDITLLGATIEHYKTGNVSSATWCGESVSNADGRRLEATKVYVDLNDGELNVITNFSSYSLPSVEEQAQAWYDAALRDGEPTDPEPTDADTTEAEADEMIISDTTTTEASTCYFTTDELAALEAAGFRRWQRNGLDRLYYSGDCFEAGIYAIYSDAEAKVYVDATDGEMHVEAHPHCIESHILDHVGRIYTDALVSVRAEASTEQPTELAAAIAATISGTADHEQVSLWLDASDRNALSVWEQSAYGIAYAASEGCASEVAEETVENARRVYDVISAVWTRTEPRSSLYDELHDEVSEMALWLDAIETLENDGKEPTTENVIKAMRGDDDEPTDPNDDPTTTEAAEGIDYEAEWRAKHPHTTCATVWVPSYGAVCAMSARSLPIGIVTVCTGGVTETVIGKAMSKSGKTVTLTVRDESGTTHTRRRNADTMVAVRGHRINRSVWHVDWPTEDEDVADTFTDAEAETTDQPATSHASDRTNVATRIMDLWDDFDPHTYGDCCTDNGIEEVRFELEHDPAQMLDLLNDVIEDGTTEQATRAMAIIDAIERLDGDKTEEISHDHNHDKKEAPMPTMPTIRLTGGIIKGKRHIGEAHKSGKPYDTPTDERGIVTLDGETYERTVYERRTWYNMRPHKLLARYVIIDNVNYEVMSRRNAAYDRWTAERDEDGLFTGVYDFEDGKSWMSCLGDVYVLHSEADGEEYHTDFRDDYPDTGDESVFTAACDFLDKMATGWRPVNWRA